MKKKKSNPSYLLFYPIVGVIKLFIYIFSGIAYVCEIITDKLEDLHYDLSYPIDKRKAEKKGKILFRNANKTGFFR